MEYDLLSRSSTNDPLSDVLSLLKPRGYMSGGIDAGGDWAISFEQDRFFRFFAIISGACWLELNGVADTVYLQEGDVIALPRGEAFCLAGDPSNAPVDIMSLLSSSLEGRIFSWKGGGACLALGALFTFAGDQVQMLLDVLPPVVHIRNNTDRAAMRWYLERMMEIAREARPGGVLLGEHLAQMMLIEVLRLHLEDRMVSKVGWLFALADKQICKAMTAMHGNPGRRWTLQELAKLAGMSRSAFAARFKEKVGSSAMDYLIRWRMLLAADRFVNADECVSAVARSLGYESESAFGFAFKREMGCSPRQYCRTRVSATR